MTDPNRSTPTAPSEQPPRQVDELAAMEDSFPASDPPTYGQASIGDGEMPPDERPVRTAPEATPAEPAGDDADDPVDAEARRLEAHRTDPVPDDRGEEGDEA